MVWNRSTTATYEKSHILYGTGKRQKRCSSCVWYNKGIYKQVLWSAKSLTYSLSLISKGLFNVFVNTFNHRIHVAGMDTLIYLKMMLQTILHLERIKYMKAIECPTFMKHWNSSWTTKFCTEIVKMVGWGTI